MPPASAPRRAACLSHRREGVPAMKLRAIVAVATALMVLAIGSAAFAQTDCKALMPASPWGPNDQTGATNRVTAAVTKAAAAEIKDGKVITMSYPLVDGVPLFGSRFTKTILTATTLAPGGALGENNQNNMTKLGLEHLKPFATRGVVIDMVKVYQQAGKLKTNAACKKPCLDKGTLITAADIQAGLKMYNVTLREGDIVIIHTGWGDLFEQYPAQNALYNSGEPGIGKEAATWLIGQKVVAVGSDTWAVEVIPGESPKEAFIVHQMLLTDNGIHIIENVRTYLIAAEAAASNLATFFFSMTVPKGVGMTGNFVGIEGIR